MVEESTVAKLLTAAAVPWGNYRPKSTRVRAEEVDFPIAERAGPLE